MSKRPVIGVTAPDKGGAAAWFFTAIQIVIAGGNPVRIQPQSPVGIEELDALVLGGGADVEPMKYGQQQLKRTMIKKDSRSVFEWVLSLLFFPIYWLARYLQHTKISPIDHERDELEFKLLGAALAGRKPVLGICRGMQLMNVYFKGTLDQDISGYYGEQSQVSSIFPKKRILISRDSKLYRLLNTQSCNVNALHNQAIDNAGEGIRLVAREANTEIWQAIEHEEYPFVIGVQWHPEYLIQIARQRNIFRQLIIESSKVKSEL
ncbi:MAG: gamma-glutamyl-gamma-aminobutyrate hydrolase family protein [Balneolaceae bacterium]|nr:gamma-glutamyl-gamma-aminobutyrate hydrolase family protein [Balneolaceae bacterium]